MFSIPPGWSARLMVAEIGDDTFVLELWAPELAPWLAAAQPMVESLRFERAASADSGRSTAHSGETSLARNSSSLSRPGSWPTGARVHCRHRLAGRPTRATPDLPEICEGARAIGQRLEFRPNGTWGGYVESTGQGVNCCQYELIQPGSIRPRSESGRSGDRGRVRGRCHDLDLRCRAPGAMPGRRVPQSTRVGNRDVRARAVATRTRLRAVRRSSRPPGLAWSVSHRRTRHASYQPPELARPRGERRSISD